VRSYHLLKHLVARHRVFLGTFVDDPDDCAAPALCEKPVCRHAGRSAGPALTAKMRSLSALMTGEPLSLPYYRSAALASQWVASVRARHARSTPRWCFLP
jgi:hypothetical protein